jgi:hypothetical protein
MVPSDHQTAAKLSNLMPEDYKKYYIFSLIPRVCDTQGQVVNLTSSNFCILVFCASLCASMADKWAIYLTSAYFSSLGSVPHCLPEGRTGEPIFTSANFSSLEFCASLSARRADR